MKRWKVFFSVCIGFLPLFFGCASPAFAALIFSEIYPNPQTNETEWIELFNSSSETLFLSGWALWDQESQPSLIHTFTATESIPPQGYFVLPTKNVLNNTGDSLSLYNSEGVLEDFLTYSSSQKGMSWSRNIQGGDNTLVLTAPTAGLPNIFPSPTPPPTPSLTPVPGSTAFVPLQLSEILACPASGGKEWIEIFNPSDQAVAVSNYQLFDSTHSIALLDEGMIEAQGYFLVSLQNVLNNTGDSVFLFDPGNTLLDSFTYTRCTTGKSFAKFGENWHETELLTPEKPNVLFPNQNLLPADTENEASVSATLQNTSSVDETPSSSQAIPRQYSATLLAPQFHWSEASPRLLQSVFFTPPQLETGAVSVIMGSLVLMVPGFRYVKKREESF